MVSHMITKIGLKITGLLLLSIYSNSLAATEKSTNKLPDITTIIRNDLHKNIDPIALSEKYKHKKCFMVMNLNIKGYIFKTKAVSGDVELCNLLEDAIVKSELRHKKMKVEGTMTVAFTFRPRHTWID